MGISSHPSGNNCISYPHSYTCYLLTGTPILTPPPPHILPTLTDNLIFISYQHLYKMSLVSFWSKRPNSPLLSNSYIIFETTPSTKTSFSQQKPSIPDRNITWVVMIVKEVALLVTPHGCLTDYIEMILLGRFKNKKQEKEHWVENFNKKSQLK